MCLVHAFKDMAIYVTHRPDSYCAAKQLPEYLRGNALHTHTNSDTSKVGCILSAEHKVTPGCTPLQLM